LNYPLICHRPLISNWGGISGYRSIWPLGSDVFRCNGQYLGGDSRCIIFLQVVDLDIRGIHEEDFNHRIWQLLSFAVIR
jgi:hypothetical protein